MGGIANDTLRAIKASLDQLETCARSKQEDMASSIPHPVRRKCSEDSDVASTTSSYSFASCTSTKASISRQLAYALRYIDTMIIGWDRLGQYSKHMLISYFWTVESVAISMGIVKFHHDGIEYPRVFEEIMGGKKALRDSNERVHAVAKRYAGELAAPDEQ